MRRFDITCLTQRVAAQEIVSMTSHQIAESSSIDLLQSSTQKIRVRMVTVNWHIEGDVHVSLRSKESRSLTALLQQAPDFIPLTNVELSRVDEIDTRRSTEFLEVQTKLIEWLEPI
jgi:hypothetical protein